MDLIFILYFVSVTKRSEKRDITPYTLSHQPIGRLGFFFHYIILSIHIRVDNRASFTHEKPARDVSQ